MPVWTFLDYVTEDGRNLVQEWYAVQDARVRAEFDQTLEWLRGISDWEDEDVEQFKPLKQKHVGLGEVRFHVLATQAGSKRPFRRRFRPVGLWPPTREFQFILLLGCPDPETFCTSLLHR